MGLGRRPEKRPLTSALARGVGEALGVWNPIALFAASEQGAIYDPSDLSSLFQDAAGTSPVTAVEQPVGLMRDKSGRGNHASQSTAAARPVLKQDAGGRYYLRFDGVDDFLVTGSINFTATDKMTVWAGVTKLSDAAIAVLLELSTSGGNPGAVGLYAPLNAASPSYGWRSRGVNDAIVSQAGYAAPNTAVLTGIGDIAANINQMRTNGVASVLNATAQGGGTHPNAPLYIGLRGGASLPFNGNLYGLVIRGAASTAAQIAATERYLANKAGVTLP